MRLLLDSNAFSLLAYGHRHVAELVRGAEEVFLSAIVIGELLAGFRRGSRFEQNMADLNALLDNSFVSVVPVGSLTADRYARISASLRAKGRPFRQTTSGSPRTRWKLEPTSSRPTATSNTSTALPGFACCLPELAARTRCPRNSRPEARRPRRVLIIVGSPLALTRQIRRWLMPMLFPLALLVLSSCDGSAAGQPVTAIEAERIKTELESRSFRQFEPSIDASPRKAVVLDFADRITLWAQYAEGDHAVREWEITANDYRIEQLGDTSEITIYFRRPAIRPNTPCQLRRLHPNRRRVHLHPKRLRQRQSGLQIE